jgi:hypothetical protein
MNLFILSPRVKFAFNTVFSPKKVRNEAIMMHQLIITIINLLFCLDGELGMSGHGNDTDSASENMAQWGKRRRKTQVTGG